MSGTMDRPELRVEGENDQFPLIFLLQKHGIDYDTKPWLASYLKFETTGGVDDFLRGMVDVIKRSSPHPIGFVLDADSPVSDRWAEVTAKLQEAEVTAPDAPPADGFIADVPKFKTKVGIWLMPDNQRDGNIEDFLQDLIADDGPLIEHAADSTKVAKSKGAKFEEKDVSKAVLNAWLAWHEDPGHPYGRAVQKRYFDHDVELAQRFVDWFKRLYRIS